MFTIESQNNWAQPARRERSLMEVIIISSEVRGILRDAWQTENYGNG